MGKTNEDFKKQKQMIEVSSLNPSCEVPTRQMTVSGDETSRQATLCFVTYYVLHYPSLCYAA